jgi:hypothetical protein
MFVATAVSIKLLQQVVQSTVELGAAMAGATEHQVTIAFVNLGLVEAALIGQHARRHLSDIERIVNGSSSTILS